MVCVWFIHFKITLLKLKISEGPHANYDLGPVLALDGPGYTRKKGANGTRTCQASHLKKEQYTTWILSNPRIKKKWNKQSLRDTVSTREHTNNVSQVLRRNAKKATPTPTKYVRLRDLSNKRNAIKKNWSTWLVLILVVCDLNSRYVEQICRLA